jgi:uncharacterized protein
VSAPITPVPLNERAEILDVLRGFAILGIFLANSAVYSLYVFQDEAVQQSMPGAEWNQWLKYFNHIFIDGKFYSLFSLLFGVGFSIILNKSDGKGKNPLLIFYRRIGIMVGIGLAHMMFLWEGDIIFIYAVIAFFLPHFRNLSDRTIIILVISLLFTPLLFDILKVVSKGEWNLANPIAALAMQIDTKNGITETNFKTWLVDHNSYAAVRTWLEGSFFWRMEMLVGTNRIPKVLAMFLLGMLVGRKMLFQNLSEHRTLLIKVRNIGFSIGLPSSVLFAIAEYDGFRLPDWRGLADTLLYAVSVVPMSLAMTAAVSMHWLKSHQRSVFRYLAPVGRMALTNYIMQSVIAMFIYWGVGLGLGSQVGHSIFIPIAIGVYLVQVVFSNLWFRWFRFGPLEWVWRMLTYGRVFSLSK